MLQGRLHIVCGEEGFESDRGPWTVLGAQSLQDEKYVADFSASPTERSRVLQISHADYQVGTHSLVHLRTYALTRSPYLLPCQRTTSRPGGRRAPPRAARHERAHSQRAARGDNELPPGGRRWVPPTTTTRTTTRNLGGRHRGLLPAGGRAEVERAGSAQSGSNFGGGARQGATTEEMPAFTSGDAAIGR